MLKKLNFRLFKELGFYLSLNILLLSCIEASTQAMLVNREKVIECIIDTKDFKETGVFIWLFSNRLDTGSEEALAGVKNVDYKLENGTLSRYVRGNASPWQAIANLQKRSFGPWQVYDLPKSLFLKPKGEIEWRLILFPHNKQHQFLPASGPNTLSLNESIDSPGLKQSTLAIECFLDIPGQDMKRLALGYKNRDLLLWPKRTNFPDVFDASPERFNAPDKGMLWWPELKKKTKNIIEQDARLGKKINKEHKSIIFAPLLDSIELKSEILQARAKASIASGRRCYFYAKKKNDVPAQATGVVLLKSKNLDESIVEWKAIRENYFGPLWLEIDPSYWNLKGKDLELLHYACLLFRIKFILSADQPVATLSHDQTRFFMWHNFHINQMFVKGAKFKKHLVMPEDLQEKKRRRKRQYAYQYYLKELYRDTQYSFLKQLEGLASR